MSTSSYVCNAAMLGRGGGGRGGGVKPKGVVCVLNPPVGDLVAAIADPEQKKQWTTVVRVRGKTTWDNLAKQLRFRQLVVEEVRRRMQVEGLGEEQAISAVEADRAGAGQNVLQWAKKGLRPVAKDRHESTGGQAGPGGSGDAAP